MVTGALAVVHWSTQKQGLELWYQPGKPMEPSVRVHESYDPGVARVWTKDYPGATERRIGRIEVPEPEELLKRAHVRVQDSDLLGVCRYYPHGTESQQSNIEQHVERLAERNELAREVHVCFEAAFGKPGESLSDE